MNSGERYRAAYAFRPVDRLFRKEFYIWEEAIQRWKGEGLPDDWDKRNIFNFDPPATTGNVLNLGWCEPPYFPCYEEKIIEVQGDHEIIRDFAGRTIKVFKGRRHGFMPDYLKHPVSSRKDWEEDVSLRLNPDSPERYAGLDKKIEDAGTAVQKDSLMLVQGMVGGYMYLRSMVGPEDLLYAFYDQPNLIREMMERWTEIMDAGLERIQSKIELDIISIGEDICYNKGMLISPEMFREFLSRHYREVLSKARARQKKHIYFYVDTDGYAPAAIPVFLEVGMDAMGPFEVASGCDVVKIGKQYPDLVMDGGIDKRVLAAGEKEIDEYLRCVIPAMKKRGGYIPMCDHGVPDNVSLKNYLHYRKRICELD